MIANILAFVATVVVLVIIEIATKGRTDSWARIGVGVSFFGIANWFNASRRHAPKTTAAAAPVIEPAVELGDSIRAVDHRDSQKAAADAERKMSLSTSSLDVGCVIDDRLMLTRDELQQVTLNWSRFNNVLRLVTPPPVMNPTGEVTWYLVLSPHSAVFFNQSVDQIWTVLPSGISINRHRSRSRTGE